MMIRSPIKIVLWSGLLVAASLDFCRPAYSADYLRCVQPTPLRFYVTRPARPEILLSLPPLDMGHDPAESLSPALAAVTPTNASPADAGSAQATPVGNDNGIAPLSTLSPEVLSALLYSPNGTNHPPTAVPPLQFVPPPVPLFMPRSSSAVYSTDKP
jgi:hypothetical protein